MLDALGIAGDIIQGATALAGLMIVFIGNAVSGYSSYDKVQQRAVRDAFRQRAWFGFWGVFVAIVAVLLAVLAKWTGANALAIAAAFLLLGALVWAGVCAWSTAREIK
jgi:uncharacterized membrane protein